MTVNEILIAVVGVLIGVAASMLQQHLRRKRERRLRDERDGDAAVRHPPS